MAIDEYPASASNQPAMIRMSLGRNFTRAQLMHDTGYSLGKRPVASR